MSSPARATATNRRSRPRRVWRVRRSEGLGGTTLAKPSSQLRGEVLAEAMTKKPTGNRVVTRLERFAPERDNAATQVEVNCVPISQLRTVAEHVSAYQAVDNDGRMPTDSVECCGERSSGLGNKPADCACNRDKRASQLGAHDNGSSIDRAA